MNGFTGDVVTPRFLWLRYRVLDAGCVWQVGIIKIGWKTWFWRMGRLLREWDSSVIWEMYWMVKVVQAWRQLIEWEVAGRNRELSGVLTSKKVALRLKGRVYAACVRSAMLYGSETWAANIKQVARLSRAEMRMVRCMCGVSLRDDDVVLRHTPFSRG